MKSTKKLREDVRRLKEEELRLKILERQRLREGKIKAKEDEIKAKLVEEQKLEKEKNLKDRNKTD